MMTSTEELLIHELDAHDELVRKCARGELSYSAFEAAYDSFYARYGLDGHESDAEGLRLLERYASRVALHRDIWEEVLTKVTADDYLLQPGTVAAGFLGADEAVRRIRKVSQLHLGNR